MVVGVTDRLLNFGRISSTAAVVATIFALLDLAWILSSHQHTPGLEAFLFVTLMVLGVILTLAVLIGPVSWFMALRSMGAMGWQPALVFASVVTAVGFGSSWLIDYWMWGLGNFF